MKNIINNFSGKYAFLSNFYPRSIRFEGIIFPSVEHAYQAAKTLDHAVRGMIARAPSAGKAKRMGQKLTLRPDWEKSKLTIMLKLVREKFKDPELEQLLYETESDELIEGNSWHDTFWGVCNGVGKNNLGKILMRVRTEIEMTKNER